MKSKLTLICFLMMFCIVSITSISHAEEVAMQDEEIAREIAEEAPEKEDFSKKVASMSEVLGVRYAANQNKIRIVIDTSIPTEFTQMWLDNPRRLIIDLENAWISSTANREMIFNSEYAKKLRLAQFDPKTVRIVIETDMSESDSNIFAIPGGRSDGRIVVDIGKVLAEPVQKTTQDPDSPGEFKPKEDSKTEIRPSDPPDDSSKKPKDDSKKSDRDEKSKDDSKKSDRDEKSKDDSKKSDQDEKSKDDSKKSDRDEKSKDDKSKETPLKPPRAPRKRIDLSQISEEILREKPLLGKLIAIDPGHGGSDAGAIGPSGLMEKTVTLNISLALREILESKGAEVIMTRDTDIEVHEKGAKATANEELQARCDVANEAEADIFLSVHIDAFTNNNAHGTTSYYDVESPKGFKLADKIRSHLIEQIGTANRGTQRCKFYVVNKTDMPATLIEVAFISNEEEEKMLGSEEGVMKSALGIAEGIYNYFEEIDSNE